MDWEVYGRGAEGPATQACTPDRGRADGPVGLTDSDDALSAKSTPAAGWSGGVMSREGKELSLQLLQAR